MAAIGWLQGLGTVLFLLCVYLMERSLLSGHGRLYKEEDKLTAPLVLSVTAVIIGALMGLMGWVGKRLETCCYQLAFRLLVRTIYFSCRLLLFVTL